MTPKISVIVPVYNAEKYLRECIDSILSQSFQDFELILVNDGSTDNSRLICDSYVKNDDRVKVFHKENAGVSAARNTGLDNVVGEWILFADSDDYFLPDAFNLLYSQTSNDEIDLVMGNSLIQKGQDSRPMLRLSNRFSKNVALEITHQAVWGYLFKNSIIQSKQIYFTPDLAYSEDGIFILEYAFNSRGLGFISDTVYVHRENEDSVCASTDGNRKAFHLFWAGSLVYKLAEKQEKCSPLYKKLINDSKSKVILGITQIADFSFTRNGIKKAEKDYFSFWKFSINRWLFFHYTLYRYKLKRICRKMIRFR